MSDEEPDLDAWLAGESDPAADERLARSIAADPAARRRLRDEQRLVLLLRAEAANGDGERLLQAVRSALHVVRPLPDIRGGPGRRGVASLLAAAGLLLASAIWWFWPEAPAPDWRVVAHSGSIQVVAMDGSRRSLAAADRLPLAGGVELAAGATLHLHDAEGGVRLRLDQAARLAFPPDRGGDWRLEAGRLQADVEPRPGRELGIITPQARLRVLGTAFTLQVGERSEVRVERGRVALAPVADPAAGVATVAADGFAWVTGAGRLLTDGHLDPSARLVDDHEGELSWSDVPWSDPVGAELITVDGDRALRLRYDHPAGGRNYGSLRHPLACAEASHLQLRFRILQAAPQAQLSLQLACADGGVWLLDSQSLDRLPADTWLTLRVPLDRPMKKNNEGGAEDFHRDRVVACGLGISRAAAEILVDDLALVDSEGAGP